MSRLRTSRIAKAHLGLGGMHVDVDLARIERDEQRHQRMAVARQIVRIGAAHHADEQLVAHRPAIDEEILAERIGARERRQRRKAFEGETLAAGCTSTALARNSAPSTSASRASRPVGPGSAAAQVTGARSSPASVKATSGRLMARRRTTSRMASPSARSLLRNSAGPAWHRTGRAPRPGFPRRAPPA